MFTTITRRSLAIVFAFALCSVSKAQDNLLRTVALTGMPVGNAASSETFTRFSGVNLNNSGEVTFYAEIAGPNTSSSNDTGIWSNNRGLVATIVREGQQASGLEDGVLFGDFLENDARDSLLNSLGAFVFPASLTGSGVNSTNNGSLWFHDRGFARLVARDGDRPPETIGPVRFIDIQNTFSSARGISLNESGSIAFAARTETDGVGPRDPGFSEGGIWKDIDGNQSVVLRSGVRVPVPSASVPSSGGNVTFQGLSDPMLTSEGEMVFQHNFRGSVIGVGIWRTAGAAFVPIAVHGVQAVGSPDGLTYNPFQSQLRVLISQNGQIVFSARIGDFDYGVWGGSLEEFQLIALEGEGTPGIPGRVFGPLSASNPFRDIAINTAGEVAFEAGAEQFNTSLASIGIWSQRNAMLDLVAALDTQTPSQTQLPPIVGNIVFREIFGPAINESGQIAFSSLLAGEGIDRSNDFCLWAEDRQGQLQLIAREGDTIEVASGDFRTISELSEFVRGGGPTVGNRSVFNDMGQFAFHATFVDGTEGVFVSNRVAVLEPIVALLGDVNLDRGVNFLDIAPFIAVLTSNGFRAEADCDQDGDVDFLDITPFVAILQGRAR